MTCFSCTALRDRCLRVSFSTAGLKSATTDLGNGTVMHCWAPKAYKSSKANLLLIHGIGANAMWQWNEFVSPLASLFNVFVPDLLFFGDSYTARPERDEAFQARCVKALMVSLKVSKMNIVGISYGGFVAYSLAAQFPDSVERLTLCCAGICLEEGDMEKGVLCTKSVDEAFGILFPQTPGKMRELLKLSFYKPPRTMPSCFLNDFIDVMCTEYLKERKELVESIHKDRKVSDLPKITQDILS